MNLSSLALISQKRECFRVSIRKLKQEDYFNSKRFSVLSQTMTTKMGSPLDLESEIPISSFQESLSKFLDTYDEASPVPMIPEISNTLKKVSILIEKGLWFDGSIMERLITYCFRYVEVLEINIVVEFCFMMEKLFVFNPDFCFKMLSMHFVEKLKTVLQAHRNNRDIQESVFFCLTQISGREENIDILMKNDIVLEILITLLLDKTSVTLVKMISWLTYNLTTGAKDFRPYYNYGKFLFSVCAQMLEFNNKEIVTCNLASIFSLIDEDKLSDFCFNKEYLINEKHHILEYVQKCFENTDLDIKSGALKIAYKVSLGKEDHVEMLFQTGIIDSVIRLLRQSDEKLILDSLLILGNSLDCPKHLSYCFEKGLFTQIYEIFQGNSSLEMKKECILCLSQGTDSLSAESWGVLVEKLRVLDIFCEAVDIFSDADVLKRTLTAVKNIVHEAFGEESKLNFCRNVLENQEFGVTLEAMMCHQDEEVTTLAIEIEELLKGE